MTSEEKHAIDTLILENPLFSNRKIALMVGKSPTTIAKMRSRLPEQKTVVPPMNEPLVSDERLLEIARQSGLKYYRDDHPDFEELVQEIVLGVLERRHEFDPALGNADQFVVSVARQKARNRIRERRNERGFFERNKTMRLQSESSRTDVPQGVCVAFVREDSHCLQSLESKD